MTSAVPTFSGGMKENGWDWLKEIKAHFADTCITTDQARCEYFELKLCSDAARRFEELPEAIQTDWKALEAEWKRMYPVRNAYLNTTKDIRQATAETGTHYISKQPQWRRLLLHRREAIFRESTAGNPSVDFTLQSPGLTFLNNRNLRE
ncbi:hypothetical protein M422DRAFT_245239 [Sphaerobolus stellatus SS14]|nr:hypothetical protein M422DRAFT_245239 [Sphaerobolus stellatus SS14]